MVALRAERAKLLGYRDLRRLSARRRDGEDAGGRARSARAGLGPARAKALADRDALQALIAEEGGNFKLAPWDWRYYAEKLRKARYDLDESEIKPYLQLERMIEAAFATARRLFGLSLHARRRAALSSGCARLAR